MYDYQADIVRVIDGDTVYLDLDLGVDTHVYITVRLLGVNAPEHGTPEGDKATAWMREQLPEGLKVRVQTVKDKKEKYGRYLADIYTTKGHINAMLVSEGLAVPYFGGKR